MDMKVPDWEGRTAEADTALDRLACALSDQAVLCDALESVADRLPGGVILAECLHLRRAIPPILAAAHRFEEEIILPFMTERWRMPSGLAEILDQIRYEQIEEECYAEELCDALRAYGTGLGKRSAICCAPISAAPGGASALIAPFFSRCFWPHRPRCRYCLSATAFQAVQTRNRDMAVGDYGYHPVGS
jgi:hypothetical protein